MLHATGLTAYSDCRSHSSLCGREGRSQISRKIHAVATENAAYNYFKIVFIEDQLTSTRLMTLCAYTGVMRRNFVEHTVYT